MKTHIYKKEKALSVDQCNSIIEYINDPSNCDDEQNIKIDLYSVVYDYYESTPFKFVPNILLENLKIYQEEHLFLKNLYAPWGFENSWNLQKYLPGQSYHEEHMEHGKTPDQCLRILAWMFYLNDVNDGGGTRFPQQNFTAKARTGDLYIWPAGWTHSHYGIVSNTETKYIITGWCSFGK